MPSCHHAIMPSFGIKMPKQPAPVTRGKAEKVALAIRFEKEDWFKVHNYAMRQGTSIQKIMVRAVSELMERDGFDGLDTKEK